MVWDHQIGGPEDLDDGIWAMAGYAPTVHNRQWRSKGIYGVRPEWEYAERPKMEVLWGGTHERSNRVVRIRDPDHEIVRSEITRSRDVKIRGPEI